MSCPCCEESARFKEYRPKTIVCLLGEVRLSRPYYHCSHCQQGHFPWDLTLALEGQRYSLGVREITALAGVQDSFGKVAERTLVKMSGIRMSESTVERITESAGAKLSKALQAGKVFG